jgi:SAM-dependent methyltransferase
LRAGRVLDIGANTGENSRLAASLGAEVVALDSDIAATERNWMESRSRGLSVLPLIANFARPTPPAGWRNAESLSLLDRAQGRFDCILMLGILHHLLLIEQIPLPQIMEMARSLTTDGAIMEWVPSSDPRFADLVRGRDALYGHLDEEAFRRAWEPLFTCIEREELSNGRVLYLLQRRP